MELILRGVPVPLWLTLVLLLVLCDALFLLGMRFHKWVVARKLRDLKRQLLVDTATSGESVTGDEWRELDDGARALLYGAYGREAQRRIHQQVEAVLGVADTRAACPETYYPCVKGCGSGPCKLATEQPPDGWPSELEPVQDGDVVQLPRQQGKTLAAHKCLFSRAHRAGDSPGPFTCSVCGEPPGQAERVSEGRKP